jgi:hypothetical protein
VLIKGFAALGKLWCKIIFAPVLAAIAQANSSEFAEYREKSTGNKIVFIRNFAFVLETFKKRNPAQLIAFRLRIERLQKKIHYCRVMR